MKEKVVKLMMAIRKPSPTTSVGHLACQMPKTKAIPRRMIMATSLQLF